ncbi:hypothetical protein N5K27_14930 [Pigmentiphaga sp. GD03639]|jgi:hypothetical protein|uniref:Uncharacterized protein n=1 Tax=Pigmentiphaga daeguensis TaxID=414049 RepID=A0ABN1BD15_9BURK|nr:MULTISPECIES: hypothetical protein [unclassified Pigmentiphaga]MDH2237595.1 hypothetical protein [Pigmentiphaga sp. GD03639]OVZ58584.1 hypothetical protein CDO46_25425 [Pigmentiphaga sp. NML030171]
MQETIAVRHDAEGAAQEAIQRRLNATARQLERTRRVETARIRQRERLLRMLAESMAELGISGAELQAARRAYKQATDKK